MAIADAAPVVPGQKRAINWSNIALGGIMNMFEVRLDPCPPLPPCAPLIGDHLRSAQPPPAARWLTPCPHLLPHTILPR